MKDKSENQANKEVCQTGSCGCSKTRWVGNCSYYNCYGSCNNFW